MKDDAMAEASLAKAGSAGSTNSPAPPWDGKLRVGKQATVVEHGSGSEDDEDDAVPQAEIEADEGECSAGGCGTRLTRQQTCSRERARMQRWVEAEHAGGGDTADATARQEIDCQHSRVASMAALRLERFARLKRLGLRQNRITRIQVPSTCAAGLEELELYDNLIKHMDGLDECTALRSLDLSYNKLRHIRGLAACTRLEQLYLVQNRITDMGDQLAPLTHLTCLELGANRIREIRGLDGLTRLHSLWLGGNRIARLDGLAPCAALRILSIQANRLTSLAGLAALPALTELYVSDNQIADLAPVAACPELRVLDVQSNPVVRLAGLEGLARLENLWAGHCGIDAFDEIARVLADKARLEEVYFEGCPVQLRQPVLYRNKVRLALPQVDKIDAGEWVRVGRVAGARANVCSVCEGVVGGGRLALGMFVVANHVAAVRSTDSSRSTLPPSHMTATLYVILTTTSSVLFCIPVSPTVPLVS